MSIEVISLKHFSALPKTDINSTSLSLQPHAVFQSFLSDNIKQDAATTTAHSKRWISLIKDKKSIDNIIGYNIIKH